MEPRMAKAIQDANPAEWFDLIKQTERRNGVVELRHDSGKVDAVEKFHKVRLLKIDHGRWIVERPTITAGAPGFHHGDHIFGILGPGAKRWGFTSRVLASGVFQLNAEHRIPILRLAAPTHIHSAQRRAYFRVSTVGAGVGDVQVYPLMDLDSVMDVENTIMQLHRDGGVDGMISGALPRPNIGPGHKAEMFDISGNGVSLLVNNSLRDAMQGHDLYWLTFTLPQTAGQIGVVARRIRLSKDADGSPVAAFHFQYKHDPAYGRFAADLICRFAADEQRRQLQRQR
jgi:hypothetical protein